VLISNSCFEPLYVIDDNSLFRIDQSYGIVNGRSRGTINEVESDLKLVDTPFGTYRLCDLENIPLSQYKLIVLANAFHFEKG